jgi:opacity protein-like surface antigen
MKKLFITMCVALLSMNAQAQGKGDFAIGVHGGASFTKIKLEGLNIDETVTRGLAGAFAQYNFTNAFRAELEADYLFKKNHVSSILVGVNLHYLINISDEFKIYPLAGYALTFNHSEAYSVTQGNGTISHDSENDTDGGIQIGAGLQYNLGDNYFIKAEYKFQPGILGDGHVVMAGFGYRF